MSIALVCIILTGVLVYYINAGVIPNSESVEKAAGLKQIIIQVCIVLVLFSIFLSYLTSRRIYKPLGNVITVLNEKMPHDTVSEPYDVFNLELIFNDMLKKNTRLQQLWEKYFPIMEEHVVTRILKGTSMDSNGIVQNLETIGMKYEYYGVMLVFLDHYDELAKKFHQQKINMFKFCACTSIEDYFNQHSKIKCKAVNIDNDTIAVLLASNEKISDKELYESAEHLKKAITINEMGTVTLGLSKFLNGYEQINKCYKHAETSLKYRFYAGKDNIILVDENEFNGKDADILLPEKEEEIILNLLRSYEAETVIKEISKRLEQHFKNNKTSFEYAQIILTQVIHIINRFLGEEGYSLKDVIGDSQHFLANIMKIDTLDEAQFCIKMLIEKIFTKLRDKKESKYNVIISSVKKMLDEDYGNEISLDSVADQVFVSKFYLSKLFKQEVGVNFNEYLINVRIEKSKELLHHSDKKICEIAAHVGYVNHRSFTKIFKENVGVTPAQYREKAVIKNLSVKRMMNCRSVDLVPAFDTNIKL